MMQKQIYFFIGVVLLLGATASVGAQSSARAYVVSSKNGYLGVYVDEVTSQKVSQLNLPGEYGVLVSSVAENSPADKAGLKENDVIIEFNGVRIEGTVQFGRLISETPPGREVTLKVVRAGKSMDLKPTIGSRETFFRGPDAGGIRIPLPEVTVPLPEVRIPPVRVTVSGLSALGVSVQSLSKQLGEYFGVTDGHGALITSVRSDTPAERAGLRAGDVIVAVDDRDITRPSDLSRALSGKEGEVSLTILREKQKQTVRVRLERRERSDRHFFYLDNDAIGHGLFDFDWGHAFDFNYDFDFPAEIYWFDFDYDKKRQLIEDALQKYQQNLNRYQDRYREELQRYQQEMLRRRLVDQLQRNQQRAMAEQYAEQARKARLEALKQNQLRELLYRKQWITPTPSYKRLVSTTIL